LENKVTKLLVVLDKDPPFDIEDTKQCIDACINRKNGYEQRAITAENGIHIGWVDLKNYDKTNKNAELGIAIGNKEYWGKGYGIADLY
ncbi:GNAT family N-acetyltransferase, partial [Bacillus paranthracis]|uniref:GNAT family N-acetyltransferase n=1 Tax=Bacillus paranthracis TaxID=2026186 RepID=UPI00284C0FBB